VANTFIKATQVVEMARLLLQREIVLPRLVWSDFSKQSFQYAANDTVSMVVPAVFDARTRVMRSTTALTADDLTETKVDVTLDTHVYKLLNITDEQLTLDIRDFGTQVLQPQMRAVAEGLEDVIATELAAATPAATVAFADGVDDPWSVVLAARKELNDLNVPKANRVLVVGSAVEVALLSDDRWSKTQNSGVLAEDALTEALLPRAAGFTIVGSNALGENEAYAFHQTAIAFGAFAPAIPAGAADGAQTSSEGLGMRYLRDYNPTNSTGPVDRSLVDAFAGATSVEDGVSNKRLVEITYTPPV
jgi:hypothetical protein